MKQTLGERIIADLRRLYSGLTHNMGQGKNILVPIRVESRMIRRPKGNG